jgi:hypothetical protein
VSCLNRHVTHDRTLRVVLENVWYATEVARSWPHTRASRLQLWLRVAA